MPYLPEYMKSEIDNGDDQWVDAAAGLSYKIHTIIEKYMENKFESYDEYNKIIGVLECVKLELYRRSVAPIFDIKITRNGDIGCYNLDDETDYTDSEEMLSS